MYIYMSQSHTDMNINTPFELCVGSAVITVLGNVNILVGHTLNHVLVSDDVLIVYVKNVTFSVSMALLSSQNCPPNIFSKKLDWMSLDEWSPRLFPLIFDFIVRRHGDKHAPLRVHTLSKTDSVAFDTLANFVFPGLVVLHPVNEAGDKLVVLHGPQGIGLCHAGCVDVTLISLIYESQMVDDPSQCYEDARTYMLERGYMAPTMPEQLEYVKQLYLACVSPGQPFKIHEYDGQQCLDDITYKMGDVMIL